MKAWLMLALGATLFVPGLAQAATPLLGVGMAKYDDNFQTLLRNGVQQQAGVMNVDIFMENGQDSVDLQMRQLRNLVNAKVDAIIIAMVDGKSAAQMMQLAADAKIPLVFVNRNPNPEKWPAQTAFVGSNELESGTLQMEELARRAGYKGNVVILVGDPANASSLMRTEDVEKVVAKYPDMKVVQKKSATGSVARLPPLSWTGSSRASTFRSSRPTTTKWRSARSWGWKKPASRPRTIGSAASTARRTV